MEKLIPFEKNRDSLSVAADISLHGSCLSFRFALQDPEKIALDSLVPGSNSGAELARADELWKTTCFEAFWGVPGTKNYWELNIAGSGKKWNCYMFKDYRQPSSPQPCHDYKMESIRVTENSLECKLQGSASLHEIEASLCVVLRTAAGTHYFSTAHKGEKPNFHLRESFVIRRERT